MQVNLGRKNSLITQGQGIRGDIILGNWNAKIKKIPSLALLFACAKGEEKKTWDHKKKRSFQPPFPHIKYRKNARIVPNRLPRTSKNMQIYPTAGQQHCSRCSKPESSTPHDPQLGEIRMACTVSNHHKRGCGGRRRMHDRRPDNAGHLEGSCGLKSAENGGRFLREVMIGFT